MSDSGTVVTQVYKEERGEWELLQAVTDVVKRVEWRTDGGCWLLMEPKGDMKVYLWVSKQTVDEILKGKHVST